MKRGPILGFILGAVIGSGVTYMVMRTEVQRAVEQAKRRLQETVRTVGKEVEKAGKELQGRESDKQR